MFQTKLISNAADGSAPFVTEWLVKSMRTVQDYVYRYKPVFGRGHCCTAEWDKHYASLICSSFLSRIEIPGINVVITPPLIMMRTFAAS